MEEFQSDEVVAWSNKQNELTEKYLESSDFVNIQNKLTQAFSSEYFSMSYFNKKSETYFYNSGREQHNLFILKGDESEVLLDPNKWSEDQTINLDKAVISPNKEFLAYSVSDGGVDWRTIKIIALQTSEKIAEINEVKFSEIKWSADSTKIFYNKYPKPAPSKRLSQQSYNAALFYFDLSTLDEAEIKTFFSEIGTFLSLRDINPIVGSFEGSLLAYSLGISNWHKKNSFCSNCGHKTIITKAGHQRNCLNKKCLNIHFPRTDPAVIMLIYNDDKILLGRQKVWPSGMYSTLAGFVETGETIENAVRREVFEEAGIKIKNIQYHSSQPWPFPASVMLGFYAEASSTKIKLDENEVEDVQWFSRKEVINFTHQNKFLPRKISIARRLIDDWINKV